jgi:glucokinase
LIAPGVIEADVRAAARAESLFGSGRAFRSFLYITVGTGISSCLMLDGTPYLGANGLTGTMASSPLGFRCTSCGHANHQTLEEIASGPALVRRFNAAGGNAQSGYDVLAAVAAGNAGAARVVETAGEALGSQIGLLVGTLDPEAVVIGGGLGSATGPFWDTVIDSIRRHIWSDQQRGLPILQAAQGADAGWLGAAAAAWRHFNDESRRA